ncbi:putative PEP-binding protein [Nonomuraea soli]|uniref:Phosphoenolpyruvate-protein phosphotransferase n=1 Tax=Nonomuraea soli TaxID=1032476 RepID=A0A7W0HPH3_9ACTN|nr:putative PEP-binding protein [Nonomuraea soli]MBA2890873.1 phosphotransferase system enzyme I (PtsI) [Nonomuraea soli]
MGELRGLGVSPGRTAGPVIRMAAAPTLEGLILGEGAKPVAGGVGRALGAVAAELEERARRAQGEAADILEAQAMMAADPALAEAAEEHVKAGLAVPHALDAAFAAHREALLAAGGYFAERAADLDDLRNRAIAAALGLPMPGVPDPGHPFVLVAEDLSPADTAGLSADVLALVTEKGGPTGHTAILARARGLPAVVACHGVLDLAEGTLVSVDGGTGEVRTGLDEPRAAAIRERAAEDRARLAAGSGPGRTADDHPVKLLANIGSAADLAPGAEGVGLFRTEFLFLGRRSAPSFDEQVSAYARVFEAVPDAIVRTLDAGTDKPLPFLGLDAEPNPALGIRGLRVDRLMPEVLDTQLAAIARAARATGARPSVMAPMVSTPGEAARFAERAAKAGIQRVGVMIEVPAAALLAAEVLAEVDFLSIGTNDLGQYAFAADRQHPGLADLLDPRQPALLRLVRLCAEAGLAAGKPVGVCGEAAGDPRLAPILVGLGVSSLSMSALSIPGVRAALAERTLDDCRREARAAVTRKEG